MATVIKSAQAGLVKKNDVLIEIHPAACDSGISIKISSSVLLEFGRQIEATVHSVLQEKGVSDVLVQVQDKGAMDFVIRARTETAVRRALSEV